MDVASPLSEIAILESIRLEATARDGAGHPVSIGAASWSVSDTAIARITSDGVLTGRARGTVSVSARISGVAGVTQVTVLPATLDTVRYGEDVPTGVRSAVRALLSSADSVDAASRGSVRIAEGSDPTPVFAINSSGDPLLGATVYGYEGAGVELSMRSTARMLVESLLLSPMAGVPVVEVREQRATIEGHPRFTELVGDVADATTAGRSYLESEAALTLAVSIAIDVAAPFPAPVAPSASMVSAAVLPLDLFDKAGGPDYKVENRAFFPFALSAHDEAGNRFATTTVEGRRIQLTSFPWSFGGRTVATLEGRNGDILVSIGQNDETRKEVVLTAVSDLIGGFFTVLGTTAPDGGASLAVDILGSITPNEVIAIADAPLHQSLLLVGNLAWGQRDWIVDRMVATAGRNVTRLYIQTGLRQALALWSKADAALFFAERTPFYVAWSRYGGETDALEVCQFADVFSACMTGRYSFEARVVGTFRGQFTSCSFYGTAELRREGTALSGSAWGPQQTGCYASVDDVESWLLFVPDVLGMSGTLDGTDVQFSWRFISGFVGRRTATGFFGVREGWSPGEGWSVRVEVDFTRTGDASSELVPGGAVWSDPGADSSVPPGAHVTF